MVFSYIVKTHKNWFIADFLFSKLNDIILYDFNKSSTFFTTINVIYTLILNKVSKKLFIAI